MIGRISSSRTNRHHRRRTIIHGDVFRHSFIDGHRTHRPSEKDDVLSNTNVIRNESSSPPTLLRPSRAETTKRISAIPRRVILDVTTSLSRVLPEFLRRAFRIFSSLMLAISLFFSISVQSSWARNGSELHTSRLDRRAQSSPSSSSSSSSSYYYYLQSNPTRNNPPPMETTDYDDKVVSVIQTTRGSRESSSSSSSDGVVQHRKRKKSEQQLFADERRRRRGGWINNDYSRGRGGIEKKRAVGGISMLILAATVAASTFRASRRQTKTVRNATPFGIIRNQSPLGNGVSVIRVRMALGFDDTASADDDDARSLLRRLHLEEKELYARTVILASQSQQLQQQQQQLRGGMNAQSLRQRALVDYLSNGEFWSCAANNPALSII